MCTKNKKGSQSIKLDDVFKKGIYRLSPDHIFAFMVNFLNHGGRVKQSDMPLNFERVDQKRIII